MTSNINGSSGNQSAAIKNPGDINIHLTPAAVDEVRRRLSLEHDTEHKLLRLKVQAGGCSGLVYDMEFVTERGEKDREFDFDGLKVIVDARSLLYIAGMTLDYSQRLVNGGFQFSNPRATRSCGCGTSFSV